MEGEEENSRKIQSASGEEKTVAAPSSGRVSSSSFLYYLGLGTNLGDREAHLHTAVHHLAERVGEVAALSGFYSTEPWGFVSNHVFLNAVVCIRTLLAPLDVLACTQAIERDMGRVHKSANGVYADRVIDIDLLLCFDGQGKPVCLHTPLLTLPHPLMHLRDFVMEPLTEIAPEVAQAVRTSFLSL